MLLTNITNNNWFIAAIVIGSLLIVASLVTFIIPHRKVNLLTRLIFDVLNIVDCVCIYFATNTGAIIVALVCDGVSIIRDIVFYNRKKGNIIDKIYWPIGFNIIYALSLIWTWAGPIALLPVFGNIINTSALYIYKKKVTRIVSLIGEVMFITYFAILLPSSGLLTMFSLIASISLFVSALIGLVVIYVRDKKRKQDKTFSNEEIE